MNVSIPTNKLPLTSAESRLISERDFVAVISREANLPPIDLDQVETDPDALDLLTVETAEGSLVLPICKIGSYLTIALANPFDVTEILEGDVLVVFAEEVVHLLLTPTVGFGDRPFH